MCSHCDSEEYRQVAADNVRQARKAEDAPDIAEHPKGCICTGCATARLLDLGGGRFDKDIASHLHHLEQVRASNKNTLLFIDAIKGHL